MLDRSLNVPYCVKSAQIRSFIWFIFSRIRTECVKIRTRKNSVFRLFSCNASDLFRLHYGNKLAANNYDLMLMFFPSFDIRKGKYCAFGVGCFSVVVFLNFFYVWIFGHRFYTFWCVWPWFLSRGAILISKEYVCTTKMCFLMCRF